ncbi:MAG TPA: hypothetical protein VHM91_14475, partial [Verrucomicrobiales bacterium]|nr:hypothetical protein [Verrucomicrobiales bacterium]
MSLPFRYLLLLLVSCCIPSFARAEEIEVRQGTVSITVPVPEGFAVLGPETKDFKDIYAERLAMGSEMLAIIIPSGDSPSPRQMDVEVVRSLKGHDFTKGDLELMRKASNPDQLLNGLKETSGRSGIAMEPVHDSSERYYSFLVHDR